MVELDTIVKHLYAAADKLDQAEIHSGNKAYRRQCMQIATAQIDAATAKLATAVREAG